MSIGTIIRLAVLALLVLFLVAPQTFAPLFAPVYQNMSYRNGWYVVHDAPRMIFAMGIHGQNLFVDPDNELVITKFSSHNDENDVERVLTTHRGVAEIRRLLTETD